MPSAELSLYNLYSLNAIVVNGQVDIITSVQTVKMSYYHTSLVGMCFHSFF